MREKKQYGRDIEPPKKALSSFLLYRSQVFERVKEMNPNLKITELTTLISEMWNNADEETKKRFQQQHQKNKIVTAFEKEEYEEKYGHVEKKKRRKRGSKRQNFLSDL